MTAAMRQLGPDSDGHWWDREAGVGLGMRRLAIIDLSPAGAQPMISQCGRYVLIFNGEIYNHKQMRGQLEAEGTAPNWRGHSDTEVLLASVAAWGLGRALQASNSMFALAVWDRETRTLNFACDRFGEKPLYYGWMGNTFVFGSELKALAAHPSWAGQIDRSALALLARYGYIAAPHCIFQNIRKLEPGMIATLHWRDAQRSRELPQLSAYWSTRSMVETARRSPIDMGENEAVVEFERLLSDAVGLRMEADVPLGAFLSGGYDSTAVVAMMQQQSARPVRTFTIGFTESGYNEAPFAKEIARHLGTDHTELYVTPQQAMEVIPKLPELYDEPFADSSQIPTYLVSHMARRHVTVALSGDAGDELFGGYSRYFISSRLLPAITGLPHSIRHGSAAAIRKIGAARWDRLFRWLTLGHGRQLTGDRVLKLADLLSSSTKVEGYRHLISAWAHPSDVVIGGTEPKTTVDDDEALSREMNFIEQMMYLDLVSYLPGDILTKVDRATMGVSLEGRIPFLDHRVAEFAWRLPLSHKVKGGDGKLIVKRLVCRHVPKLMMDRPKAGFAVPIEEWLRGPLREWAESLLNANAIASGGFFDAKCVETHWRQHLSGQRNWQARLWPILMFQAWSANLKDWRSARQT